ncbi:MAG: hypothetical protein J5802_08845 [Butyrivibrio sp.]|nr:hypothetical protein [Butyrivibrio sp.]
MCKSIWDWLEIEPTTDIDAIKAAYAQGSKKYHPTEHPEEFKQLRDAYKMAIKLAKSHTHYHGQAIYEASSENSYKTDRNDIRGDEKNDFDIADDIDNAEKEDVQTPGYDYSGAMYDVALSDRQKRMLSIFGRMLSFLHIDPKRFGDERVIQTIMFNWDKSPYKEEITPAFIEHALDIISECSGLSNGAVNVIEKILFAGRSDSQTENLHSRFRSVCPDVNNDSDSIPDFSTDDVQKCFYRLLDYPSLIIHGWIKFGKHTSYNWQTKILPIKDILLFYDKKAVSYYFCEELSYSVDPKTEKLTIYDLDNNVILKMKSNNKAYAYLLDHLAENGSMNVGEKPAEKVSFGEYSYLERLYSLSGLWERAGIGLVISCVVFIIATAVFSGSLAFVIWFPKISDGNIILHVINWLIFILGIVVMTISGCLLMAGVSYGLCYFLFICMLILKPELKRDIKSGHAVKVLNNEVYIFRRHLIYVYNNNFFKIVSFKNIISIGYATESEKSAPKLKVIENNEIKQFIGIYPFDALLEVIELVNTWKEELASEENRRIGLKIRGIKDLFRFRFLYAKEFKTTYWGAVLWIIFMIAMDSCMGIGMQKGQLDLTDWSMWLTILVMGIMNLYAVGEIKWLYKLRKIPVDRLVDAQKQMLGKDSYRSDKYKIYVLDDYLVSMENFEPIVIGYDEISYAGKKVPNNKLVLLIELKDGRRYEYCDGDEKSIDVILSKLAEKYA